MRRVHILSFSLICLLLTARAARVGQEVSDLKYPRIPQGWILSIAGTHYPAITQALSSVGFRVREVSAEAYVSSARNGDTLLIVPEAEGRRLDGAVLSAILRDVERGMPLLLDGATPLAAALGVNATGAVGSLTGYRWGRYAEDPIRLPGQLTYSLYQGNASLKVLADDPATGAPLVVSGSRGEGRFIHSAIPLEPAKGMVYEYLPFLAQAIADELHVSPTLAADNLCVYLDVGGEPVANPVVVAAQLRSWSVREVHLGVFYGSEQFKRFARQFIPAAHLEGIAVYAWLEYPMVGEEFWNAHPEWREITAAGKPAIMDWRLHMALEDPDCLRAVIQLMRRSVLDLDWDGVDLAELYFEAARKGFGKPDEFTPMHPTFRKMFQQRYGVDPIEIFDRASAHFWRRDRKMRRALSEYRIELVTRLTESFLAALARCRAQKPYLQITLTFIDSLRDPTVKDRFGVDADRLLALQEKYDFAVEVEDPYTVWNSGPDRYHAIGEHYRARLRPGTPFSIDINVVDREPPARPLQRPRGLELYELVAAVAANTDMVTLYGVSTFSADDMRLVPFVLGARQVIGEVADAVPVDTRRQLYWRTNTQGRTPYLDGREWPCASDSQVLIPAGKHTVSTRPQAENAGPSALRLENVNGNVIGAERAGKRVMMEYESRGRCYIILNRKPTKLLCDGQPGIARILSDEGHICLVAPQGRHKIEME